MTWYKKLHWQIIIGLLLGLTWGLISTQTGMNDFSSDFIKPFGTMFVNMLKLIAVPLVLASLIVGVANLNDITKLSRMGGRTIGIYLITTILAITIGLIVVNLVKPWEALPEETKQSLMSSYDENLSSRAESADQLVSQSPLQPLVDIIPENLFMAASNNGAMLQVVFIAILFGIGIIQIKSEKSIVLVNFFDAMNDVIIRIVDLIMLVAPYGVFALISSVIIDLAGDDLSQAITLLYALGWYCLAVLIGLFAGAATAFYFSALTMRAVGRAAGGMVEEVRRQFREDPGILAGTSKPDYASCVDISTASAQREMVVPSIVAISVPVVVGVLFGVAGVIGLLAGGLAAGFSLAIMMANAGGAWDNAKKYVEEGHHGGKGSEAHKAAIVGDTVGDPFKDTSGPSLNILIKLMAMVSVVFGGLVVAVANGQGLISMLAG